MNLLGCRRSFELPNAWQWEVTSQTSGREYRIFASVPNQEPPAGGFPVIYVLDANAVFATVTETLRVQSRRPEKTGVVPAVVIGIGYRTESPFSNERTYDFTLPREDGQPYSFKNRTFAEEGGAERFMQFIEEELKPAVEEAYPINRSQQSIIGHSLGGLFVLQMLLLHPQTFQNYIAGSPSIHWNESFIFEEAERLAGRLQGLAEERRLLVAAGELETSHRMIENAETLHRKLTDLRSSGLTVEYKNFKDEAHVSVLAVLMSQGVRFALRSAGKPAENPDFADNK
ncbi:alpha/beta hydrolase [Paenibacillus pinistramenti]|uniref:alpha/beta hydrolase n=1 Tax=Paenibacillus pinistramenti TaxID=1768003 RepID=UPI001108AC49|nr:alpha/beta hydrolase-fold protein [Paenibacillus pinistramenti]